MPKPATFLLAHKAKSIGAGKEHAPSALAAKVTAASASREAIMLRHRRHPSSATPQASEQTRDGLSRTPTGPFVATYTRTELPPEQAPLCSTE